LSPFNSTNRLIRRGHRSLSLFFKTRDSYQQICAGVHWPSHSGHVRQ
jgi:hypothetical protein